MAIVGGILWESIGEGEEEGEAERTGGGGEEEGERPAAFLAFFDIWGF
jgi:hypothetical protein